MDSEKLSYKQLEELTRQYHQKVVELQNELRRASNDSISQVMFAAMEILKLPKGDNQMDYLQQDAFSMVRFLFDNMKTSVTAAFLGADNNEEEEEEEEGEDEEN